MDAAIPLGHRPVRETLIQIARQESNQRRMDPGIGVEAIDHLQPVAMPHRGGVRRYRGLTGATDGFEASVPKTPYRSALFPHRIVFVEEHLQRRPRVRWHIPTKTRQRRRFFQDPR